LPNAQWLAEVKGKLEGKCQASGIKPGEAPPDPADALAAEAAEKAKAQVDDGGDDSDTDDDKDAA
jgi:hypothetical protein